MLASTAYFSAQDDLALEGNSNIRHEYRCGSVYAMAGSSDDHNRLAINLLTFAAKNSPITKPCRV